jgi:CRISPR/Cas system CSM-associated protein Csm3 (group 7 of RAMP superfamily)
VSVSNQYEKVEIHYSFSPTGGLKIGSGHGKNGIIDNAYRVKRKSDGSTYYPIPATSIKGRIRYSFIKYRHLLTGESENVEYEIFGKSGKSGWARFSDLLPAKDDAVLVGASTNTSMDRFRNTARHTSLRVEEYVQMNNQDESFHGVIEGFRIKNENKKDVAALLFSILATDMVGADKTTGFGKGKTAISQVVIGNEEWEPSRVSDFIKKYL